MDKRIWVVLLSLVTLVAILALPPALLLVVGLAQVELGSNGYLVTMGETGGWQAVLSSSVLGVLLLVSAWMLTQTETSGTETPGTVLRVSQQSPGGNKKNRPRCFKNRPRCFPFCFPFCFSAPAIARRKQKEPSPVFPLFPQQPLEGNKKNRPRCFRCFRCSDSLIAGLVVGLGSWAFIRVLPRSSVSGSVHTLVQGLVQATSLRDLVPYAVAMIIIMPVCEELYFRGSLHAALRSHLGKWASVLLCSMAFAALHGRGDLFLAYTVVGTLWAGLAGVFGLPASIVAHSLYNLLCFVALVRK